MCKYIYKVNNKELKFQSKSTDLIQPTLKKRLLKNGIDLISHLQDLGFTLKLCGVCKKEYNPNINLEFDKSDPTDLKITNVKFGFKHNSYETGNRFYCYRRNPNCPGISMNSNSIEYTMLTLNLSKTQAIEYIHTNNRSPFYLENHSSAEDYTKSQQRGLFHYTTLYGIVDGTARYEKFCEKQAYRLNKSYYIDKYGEEDGLDIWEKINKKKAITLASLQTKYGYNVGEQKYLNWINSVSKTNSTIIEKYVLEDGLHKIYNRNKKSKSTRNKNGNSSIIDEMKIEYIIYCNLVYSETNYQLMVYGPSKFGKNWKATKKKESLAIDHMFSIKNGFLNKIDPLIIANIENLELIPSIDNLKKGSNNSIEMSDLLLKIEKRKYGK